MGLLASGSYDLAIVPAICSHAIGGKYMSVECRIYLRREDPQRVSRLDSGHLYEFFSLCPFYIVNYLIKLFNIVFG